MPGYDLDNQLDRQGSDHDAEQPNDDEQDARTSRYMMLGPYVGCDPGQGSGGDSGKCQEQWVEPCQGSGPWWICSVFGPCFPAEVSSRFWFKDLAYISACVLHTKELAYVACSENVRYDGQD